jgi:hypothetical protein
MDDQMIAEIAEIAGLTADEVSLLRSEVKH